MKKLLIILGGVLVVTIVAIIIIIAKLGTIVKTAVNTAGPKITQTTFVLNDADISPFSGKGSLKELTIGNPKGWTSAHAFFLKEISIEIDTKSISSGDHVIINRINIDNPEIIYETTNLTNSNLQDLIKNIQQSAGGEQQPTQPAQPADKPTQQTEPAKETKIEIKSFRLANVTVQGIAAGKSYTVTLPEFVMTDIGTKEGGLTPQELSIAIIKEITIRVAKAGATEAAKRGLFEKAGEGLRDLLGGKK